MLSLHPTVVPSVVLIARSASLEVLMYNFLWGFGCLLMESTL